MTLPDSGPHGGKQRHPAAALDFVIHRILVVGVSLSLLLVLIGLLLLFTTDPAEFIASVNLSRIKEPPADMTLSMRQFVSHLAALRGTVIITLGLALLVVTPFLRVVVSLIYFSTKRDYWYVLLTALVLIFTLVPAVLTFFP